MTRLLPPCAIVRLLQAVCGTAKGFPDAMRWLCQIIPVIAIIYRGLPMPAKLHKFFGNVLEYVHTGALTVRGRTGGQYPRAGASQRGGGRAGVGAADVYVGPGPGPGGRAGWRPARCR